MQKSLETLPATEAEFIDEMMGEAVTSNDETSFQELAVETRSK